MIGSLENIDRLTRIRICCSLSWFSLRFCHIRTHTAPAHILLFQEWLCFFHSVQNNSFSLNSIISETMINISFYANYVLYFLHSLHNWKSKTIESFPLWLSLTIENRIKSIPILSKTWLNYNSFFCIYYSLDFFEDFI